MSSVLERNWTLLDCLLPFRQNRGGNEERHPHQAFFSDVANGLVTSLYNGFTYVSQSMCFGSRNQLPCEPANIGSLHSNENISGVLDPLHLGNVVRKCSRVENIKSTGPDEDSEIENPTSAEGLRSPRVSSQAHHPAQSKRLRSCDRAESRGKRMCFPTAMFKEKKQDQKCRRKKKRGQNVEDEKEDDEEKDDDEEEDDEEEDSEEKQEKKKQDKKKEQEEMEENELWSNLFVHQWEPKIEDVFTVKE